MKILACSNWAVNLEMPSQIAPIRMIRAFHRHGHDVTCIDGEHEWHPKQGEYQEFWGSCITIPEDWILPKVDELCRNWEPDLIIVFNTINQGYCSIAKKYDIPIAAFQSDPFYWCADTGPGKEWIMQQYSQADLILCNEGHATEIIKNSAPELADRVHTINHAYDPYLGPSDEELENIKKEYLASCCAGLEVQRHAQLIRLFYIPSLGFPNQKFAVAGSLDRRFPRHVMSDPKAGLSKEEIEKYTDFDFNITLLSEPLEKPLAGSKAGVSHWDPVEKVYKPWFGGGLSQPKVHRAYAASFYGFCPYGDYLTKSPFCRYTYGTKLTEQLGSSVAGLCNYIPDIEEYIINGKTGFIVNTTQEAVEALQFAVDNPEAVMKMGKNARKLILAKHTWDHRIEELEKIIAQA